MLGVAFVYYTDNEVFEVMLFYLGYDIGEVAHIREGDSGLGHLGVLGHLVVGMGAHRLGNHMAVS